ncbi:unnamed protein product [Cylicostephanus goldi]|uniref:Uncharacterized protein n=1 Tax=Cylicostephanus goldi TaxID=71465 RepID=A0A3P7QBT2_CYLGO|nr:unnamed protein product [Cylicostephanus goldi]
MEGVMWGVVHTMFPDKSCSVRVNQEDNKDLIDISKKPYVNKELLRRAFDLTKREPNVAIKSITDNCKQLMEMEPQNMWARYMYTLCLMETQPAESHEEILSNLGKLATELDPKRKEIYKNLASRQILNKVLRSEVEGEPLLEKLMKGEESQLAIRNAKISRLTPNVPLCNLKFLSLGYCPVNEVDCVLPALKSMCSLERFLYCETPLVSKTSELGKELPNVRLIPHYL